MKKVLLTTTALIGLGIGAAAAADLAVGRCKSAAAVAMYNLNSFYAGVNGGWGSSTMSGRDHRHRFPGGQPWRNRRHVGGQIGYRWQAASWVFGVEAQGDWADFHGSEAIRLRFRRHERHAYRCLGLFTGEVG